jgi:[pyruvate, water dikinase]-phosphate phosphotransferase / [pyruvate, water dikinase] kinase
MDERRSIFFISDSTAITAHTLGKSLLTQFENIQFDQTILPFVNTVERARQAVAKINRAAKRNSGPPIIFSTLIDPQVRDVIMTSDGVFFDFFDPFLSRLERELRTESTHAVGRYHRIDDDDAYDVRMDAVNYALNNDDGVSVKYFDKADIIIVGVSRTGKTPTCIFLGLHFGLYAANYPLTEEDISERFSKLPRALQPFHKKLFGLTINPDRLQQIRSVRRPNSRYSSITQCEIEVSLAEAMFMREKIPFLNVTTISVEEIAATLIRSGKLQRRL